MNVIKIGQPWITVSDLEKTKKFCSEVLHLTISEMVPEIGWMEVEGKTGPTLGIAQAGGIVSKEKAGSNAILCLIVDDIAAAKKEIESKVRFLTDIIEIPGQVKLATFTDLDGNKFQLIEHIA